MSGAAVVAAACLAILVPFTGKAFHIDDTLFLRVARQIHSAPLDFYGFRVNWYGFEMPMHEVTKNPPLTGYYIALVAAAAGWSETALHVAFLLPAVAAALGTWALARRLCGHPVIAALATILTPAFVVSSTNVMSDTMLLAFWVWAVVLWTRGIEGRGHLALAGAAALTTFAGFTKYVGFALVPLLFARALFERRRLDPRWLYLLLPILGLLLYQIGTRALYGRGLVGDAAAYATAYRQGAGNGAVFGWLTALSFVGGGLAGLALFTQWLWSRRALVLGIAAAAFVTLLLPYAGTIGPIRLNDAEGVRWALLLQLGLFAAAGVQLLVLAGVEAWTRRDGDAALLALWLGGTVAFAALFNWSVSARAILPMAPAAAILLVRRLERAPRRAPAWLPGALLVPAAAIALAAGWADYRLANSARLAAGAIHAERPTGSGTLWFQGHWGFQHYMEAAGARPIDRTRSHLAPGDLVAVPRYSTNVVRLPAARVDPWRVVDVDVPGAGGIATMNISLGAGFYSDVWGPLPIAIGRVPPERYFIFRVVQPIGPGEP